MNKLVEHATCDATSFGALRIGPPEFFLGVLDRLPTPVLVLGRRGVVMYANAAVVDLLGYEPPQGAGSSVVDIVHPSDRQRLLDTVSGRTATTDDGQAATSTVRVRLLSATAEHISIEATLTPRASDAAIGGTILELRLAPDEDILGQILSGVSGGAEQSELLTLLARFIAMEPLDIDAVVLQRDGGQWRLLSSTTPAVGCVFDRVAPADFAKMVARPERVAANTVSGDFGSRLRGADISTLWRLSVDSDLIEDDAILRFEVVAIPRHDVRDVRALTERLHRARELARLIMKAMNDRRLLTAADFDALTGVLTRAALLRRMEAVRYEDGSTQNSLVFLDLDGFKPINDSYGHAVGDAVLKTVAQRIASAVRSDDVVARLGGDEFVVLLLDTSHDPAVQQMIANRIVGAIRQPISIPDTDLVVSVSASAGFAIGHPDESMVTAMARADKLMYTAKSLGGGAVVFEGREPAQTGPLLEFVS